MSTTHEQTSHLSSFIPEQGLEMLVSAVVASPVACVACSQGTVLTDGIHTTAAVHIPSGSCRPL